MDMRKVVGLNVLRIRRERGISQEELSFRSGFGRAYLSGLQTGKRNPTVVSLWEIANALDAEPADLLRAAAPEDQPTVGLSRPKRRGLTKRQAIRASGLTEKGWTEPK
ncbi:helix-turn-helix domain-containing protein [uncultured Enterovirga sp.]|uniref:helix-turn-helix domain-containing protein n=1 Tax=uncultured Enterovirga sp. TaxID=2026352 RepID=UPI0035CCA8DE